MKRTLYLDAIKALAIFLVLLGHCCFYFDKNLESSCYIHSTIYMFHMPLFMLLSGFFAESSFKKSFWDMVRSKFTQLIIPVLTSSIIVCSFMFITGCTTKNILAEFIGGNWFLKTLFVCYIFAYISNLLFKNNQFLAFIFSWIILIIVPVSFLQINWMYLFFWMGIFLKKNIDFIINHRLFILKLSITLLIICTLVHFHYRIPNFIELNVFSLTHSPFCHLLRVVNALSWSITIILSFSWMAKTFEQRKFFRTIAETGKYTLGIYVLQTFILQRLIIYYIPSIDNSNHFLFNFLYMPLLSIVVYFICILIIKFLSKNKYCDLLVFGGQYYRFSK